ncbi:aminodeoxychorismate synthase component I [Parasalinivibrio latis]|uniref:aminodeoxychorismate synthase component I n=1 Tax=Parasalinivibrio latis TaxID=2952610 RepID=UPI0030E3F448
MTGNPNTSISLTSLQYSPDAVPALFSHISHLPWAMLLHSASASHPDNRFDILVADPIATVVYDGTLNHLTTKEGSTRSEAGDPFAFLNTVQNELLPSLETHPDIPFLGGALGYFSYDLGRTVEQLPVTAINDTGIPDMSVGLYNWALVADHQKQTVTLVQPEGSDRLSWLNSFEHSDQAPFNLVSGWESNLTKDAYFTRFAKVQEYLLAGDCYQINLAQRFSAAYSGDEWDAYLRLANQNGAPFSAFIRLPEAAVLSVSPERFLQLKDKDIETKPIKGTRPRSTDASQDEKNADDLRHAEKDRAENLMIVDLLRNDIGRVASPGSVSVPALFEIESFPAVHHLVSTVKGKLGDQYSACDLMRACFPGGSITGAPKVRAMEIIEELEPHRRSVYCGSIGYISRCGTMDTSITIRTQVCHNGKIFSWAGGGLVADSKPEAEYQETLDKVSRILPVLSGEKP